MQDPKTSPKIAFWAPSQNVVGLYLRNEGTYRQSEKQLVKQQYLPHMSSQYGELQNTSGWNRFVSLGHPSKLLECRAVTLPRRETRWNLQGCLKLTKRSQPLVDWSSPYYGDMWRRYCCLTSFFCDCRYVPQLRRYSPTKLSDGAEMAIFGDFFGSCISSEPHAAHFRPAF